MMQYAHEDFDLLRTLAHALTIDQVSEDQIQEFRTWLELKQDAYDIHVEKARKAQELQTKQNRIDKHALNLLEAKKQKERIAMMALMREDIAKMIQAEVRAFAMAASRGGL